MDKVYQRINWDTTVCNDDMDSDTYLHRQIARAICLAAYEKPLTVEEISISTGLPTMYIEDELPRLEYGDAIRRVGNKYVTDFIIFRLKDRGQIEGVSETTVNLLADKFEAIFKEAEGKIGAVDFYGNDFGMGRLGYIVVPYVLRRRIRDVKNNRLKLENGPYPPRKDGGYGWFTVEETADETERASEYNSGCNVATGDAVRIYYYWTQKYFDYNVYHNNGTCRLLESGAVTGVTGGFISKDTLSDEDVAHFVENNLIAVAGGGYQLNVPYFTQEQFAQFVSLFDMDDEKTDERLAEWILSVRGSFERFVPKHLHGQINQWMGCYLYRIIGYVTDELIRRGALCKPDGEKPLTCGVFCVEGESIRA